MTGMTYPKPGDRISIIGRTGSGKTMSVIWLIDFLMQNQARIIVLDHKGGKIWKEIEGVKYVDHDFFPKEPGIFLYRLRKEFDDDAMNEILEKVSMTEDIILVLDEGYMIGRNNKWINLIYTQGREKLQTVITLTQRPVFVSVFAFSESDFFMIFELNLKRDKETVQGHVDLDLSEVLGKDEDGNRILPEFHFVYYGVKDGIPHFMSPITKFDQIIGRIEKRLAKYQEKVTIIENQQEDGENLDLRQRNLKFV